MDSAPPGPHAGYRAWCTDHVPALPDGWAREELSREPVRTNDRPMARANRLFR
jgi:hypothetical protein